MIECRFCQKTFSKGEHLRRHERSHTGSKPYQCKQCKRSFSRQDSLARHEKLHIRRSTPYDAVDSPTMSMSSIEKPPVTPESIRSSTGDMSDLVPGAASDVHAPPSSTGPFSLSATAVPQHGDAVGVGGVGVPVPAADLDFDLIWPDSEDLLQTLLSTDSASQWQMPLGTLPFSASPSTSDVVFETPSSFDERPPSIGAIPSGGNHQAVQDVSKMVSNLSSSVTAAAKSNSITSVFLDECLHMFFVKFIPTFPVLHRATFVFRECAHPLLLNAIAIGSLYLGPKDAVAKGEALWHLAHTAVATSWQNLITHRGPYDSCDGVQLVLTSVLSQLYGALSKNRTIRSTSQAFHSLGLVWARRCGMLDSKPFPATSIPSMDAPEAEKDYQWRLWVAREIQQRAILAHYMLDGLISHMSGEPTSVRHATNQLTLPSDEAAFEASTASEWIAHMQSQQASLFETATTTSFRSIMRRLFTHTVGEPRWLDTGLSAFTYKVILEGLQSLISDDESEEETAVGVPSRDEVRRALIQVYESIRLNSSLSSADRLETLLRWHAICLDTCVDSASLCRNLCARYEISQHIWRGGQHSSSTKHSSDGFDLSAWVATPAARIALLHAMTIQEMVEQLPRGRAHAIHMPSSLFAAATVYSAFALGGQPTIKIPCAVVWQDVLLFNQQQQQQQLSSSSLSSSSTSPTSMTMNMNMNMSLAMGTEMGMSGGSADTDTARYIRGETLQGWPSSSSATVTSRNLLYELNSVQKLFRCLLAQWGVAYDMDSVVEKWIGLCH